MEIACAEPDYESRINIPNFSKNLELCKITPYPFKALISALEGSLLDVSSGELNQVRLGLLAANGDPFGRCF
jgi:hypothetical protein